MGALSFVAWVAGLGASLALHPEWIPIAPLTAVLATLQSAALYAISHRAPSERQQRLARWLSAAVVLGCLLALLRVAVGDAVWLERALAGTDLTINGIPIGRVSPITAILFLLLSGGFLARESSKAARQRLALLSLAAGSTALVFLQGYLLGAPLFYDKTWVPIAEITALILVLLALGNITAAGSDVWPLRVFSVADDNSTTPTSRQAVRLVAVVVGVIIATSGAFWFRGERRETIETGLRNLERLAVLKAAEVEAWRRGHLRAAEMLRAAAPDLARTEGGATTLEDWLRARVTRDGYAAAAAFDGRGQPLASYPRPELFIPASPGVPLDSTSSVVGVRIRDVYRSGADQFLDLWVPVPDANPTGSATLGWVMLRVNARRELASIFQNLPLPRRSSELLLLRVRGNTVEPLIDLRGRVSSAPTPTLAFGEVGLRIFEDNDTSATVRGSATDRNGVEVLVAARRVRGTPWYVVATLDRSEMLAPVTRGAIRLGILTLLLILGTTGVTNALAARRDLAAADRELLLVRQRERSVEELRRSEDRYARALRGTNDGLWDWNIATNELYVSPRFVALLGGDGHGPHTLDSAFLDRLHPDDAEEMQRRLQAHLDRDEVFDLEFRLRRESGDYHWFWTRGEVERAADGTPVRMAGAITDVTARRLAEDTLHDTDRILRMRTAASLALVHASTESELLQNACSVAVREGGYRMAWVGYAQFDEARSVKPMAVAGDDRGYLASATITWDESPSGQGPTGRCIRLGVPQVAQDLAHEPRFGPWRDAAIERGFAASCSIPLRIAGRVIGALMLYSERPFAFNEAEITLLNEIANDLAFGIGARRDHLAVAKEQERAAFFRAVMDDSDDAIFIVDLKTGRFLDFNETAHRQLGYTAEELRALSITALVPRFSSVDEWREAEARLGSPDVQRTMRSVHRRKDGSEFPVEVNRTRLSLENQDIVLVSARDITAAVEQERERAALQEQLLRSQRMESVGRLAGGIAHDFNNLLTVINNTADLALQETPRGAPIRNDLMGIRAAGQRAATLTRQLLAFSRQQVLRQEALDLNALVKEFVGLVRRVIGEDIRLDVALCAERTPVFADPSQLEQVLMNLCVNARDAMPRGGTLRIRTSLIDVDADFAATHQGLRAGPHIRLTIADSGVGMPPEVQQRIFEPFFTTKEAGKGTGLGLATVYGIIQQSEGSISVESTLGQGTRFDVFLPLSDADDIVERASGPSAKLDLGHETILIVEDEPAIRMVANRILSRSGYTVLEAGSGDEALKVINAHEGPLHLVITDLVMPGMGGIELAHTLREQRPTLPVLLSSGYSADAVSGELNGEDGWPLINKPYAVQDLLRMVRQVLGEAAEAAARDGAASPRPAANDSA